MQREPGALARRGLDRDPAAMRLHDAAREVESQADAAAFRAARHEPVEEVRQEVGRDAGALVDDLELAPAAALVFVLLDEDVHGRATGRMPRGVRDEVVDALAHPRA